MVSEKKPKYYPRMGHSLGAPPNIMHYVATQDAMVSPKFSSDFYFSSQDCVEAHDALMTACHFIANDAQKNSLTEGICKEWQPVKQKLANLSVADFKTAENTIEQAEEAFKEAKENIIKFYFEAGYSKLSLLKLPLGDERDQAVCMDMACALRDKFGIAASMVNIISSDNKKSELYLAGMQSRFVKQPDGRWKEVSQQGAADQFFAMAIAKGLVDENALRDDGIMLGMAENRIQAIVNELRAEGVKPILAEPLYSGENWPEKKRVTHVTPADADAPDVTYGDEHLAVSEKAHEHATQNAETPDNFVSEIEGKKLLNGKGVLTNTLPGV